MWHYSSAGGRHGPVSEQDIAAMIANGQIRPTSFVREDTSTEWREARETALARYFSEAMMARTRAEDAERVMEPKRTGVVGGLIALGVVALSIGAIVFVTEGGVARVTEGTVVENYLPPDMLTDAALARRIEREFEASAQYRSMRTFARMEELFPDDYHALMLRVVPLHRRRASEQEVAAVAEQHMGEFLHRNKEAMLRASPETLSAVLNAQASFVAALQRRDAGVCAMVLDGTAGTGPRSRATLELSRAELDALNLALFDAIKSGETSANDYTPLGEPDWRRLGLALIAGGVDAQLLQQFGESAALMGDRDKCLVATRLFAEMAREPDLNTRARYAAEVVRGM